MIQDYILAAGSIVFAIALVPMVFSKKRPPLFTSLTTGLILAIFSGTYASLGLLFSCVTTAISAVLWLVTALLSVLDKHLTTCYTSKDSPVNVCYRSDLTKF